MIISKLDIVYNDVSNDFLIFFLGREFANKLGFIFACVGMCSSC